jgi:hypothetical protein
MRLKYAAAWLVCQLAILMVGCASPLTTARKSVSAAATLGSAAGVLVSSIDEQKEEAIAAKLYTDHNVAAAEKARDDWHAQRVHVTEALRTYNAVVVAAGATAELAGDKTVDVAGLLVSLMQAYTALKGALSSFGVTLPTGGI